MRLNFRNLLADAAKWSFSAIIIVLVFYSYATSRHRNWTMDEPGERAVIKDDVQGYYSYLPATFIFKDPRLDFLSEKGFRNEYRFIWIRSDNGNRLIQYSSGLSILYAPFFFTAHLLAPLAGESRDGFNYVYQFFLVLSALFYFLLGLIFLRKLLLKYFKDRVVALVILLLAFGTNLLYYTVYEGPMPHSYSFSLIVIFLYLADSWYRKPTTVITILSGLVYGLLVLVRPSNILVGILFFAWRVSSIKELWERIRYLLSKYPLIILMMLCFIIPWIPQMIYWKAITGHFFYNSYDKVGSAFYFDAPQTHLMLFSFRKGWLVYTPLMLFALAGFVFLRKNRKEIFWPALIYMLITIYVLSSWWAWWFGGGFGSRAMIDTYGIMAFPLAALLAVLFHQGKRLRYSILAFMVLLAGLNLFQTKQYLNYSIHYVAMDRDAYFSDFFKLSHRNYFMKLSDPDHDLARLGIYYYYDYNEDYDAFRSEQKEIAKQEILTEIRSRPKLQRSIKRHARREQLQVNEVENMVVDMIYSKKAARKSYRN